MITKKERILIVGDFNWPWYQESCAQELEKLGHEVMRFNLSKKIRYLDPKTNDLSYYSFFHYLQYKFAIGPIISSISKDLIKKSMNFNPSIVWFYNVKTINTKRFL